MTILPISNPAFASYGKVLEGYDTQDLLRTLEAATPLPEGVEYVPSQPELESLPLTAQLSSNAYGGMPIQMGWCNGPQHQAQLPGVPPGQRAQLRHGGFHSPAGPDG